MVNPDGSPVTVQNKADVEAKAREEADAAAEAEQQQQQYQQYQPQGYPGGFPFPQGFEQPGFFDDGGGEDAIPDDQAGELDGERDPAGLDGQLAVRGLSRQHFLRLHQANPKRQHLDAWARGRLGFMQDLATAQGNQVLSVEDEEYNARSWTVTMVAHRYQRGIVSATLPPDNQTGNSNVKFVIEWGVAGAMDRAVVDYPWAGISFSVAAASIRIAIPPTAVGFNPIVPMIGGFLTPKFSAHDTDAQRGPCFTAVQTVVASATNLFAIPARARSYRMYLVGDQGTANGDQFVLQQATGAGVALVLDQSAAIAPQTLQDRWGAFPLAAVSQIVSVTNNGATNAGVALEFLLDMG
jgi:hypothetical protein